MIRRLWTLRLYGFLVIFVALLPASVLAAAGDASSVGGVPTELITISALVGMVLPGLVAVLNRYHWPTEAKAACAFIVCVVAAAVIAWWDQTLDWSNYRIAILTVLTSALGFYHAIWRPSGVAETLEKVTG